MTEAQEPEEEYILTIDARFNELQSQGKCGEMQENGNYCKSPILEWLDLDPDRPYHFQNGVNMGGPRIGACGTHIKQVLPRVISLRDSVNDRRIDRYMQRQNDNILRGLRLAGFKVDRTRNRGATSLILKNPAEFLYTLDKIGVLESLGVSIVDVPQCESIHREKLTGYRRRNYGSTEDEFDEYRCMEAHGHYPATKHDDWQSMTWDDPKPETPPSVPTADATPQHPDGWVPVPTADAQGGQFQ